MNIHLFQNQRNGIDLVFEGFNVEQVETIASHAVRLLNLSVTDAQTRISYERNKRHYNLLIVCANLREAVFILTYLENLDRLLWKF